MQAEGSDTDLDELTPRQRRLQRLDAYEKSSYGQRARTVQREAKERAAGRTRPASD